MSENNGIAGSFVMGEGFPMQIHTGADPRTKTEEAHQQFTQKTALWPLWTLDQLQAFVDERVRKVLEDDAKAIQEDKAFWPGAGYAPGWTRGVQPDGRVTQVPSGVCWACREPGKAEELMWIEREGRSHLVHATAECVRAAEMKPESKEHRG